MNYEQCSKAGMTQAQTAKELGVSRQAVSQYAKANGLSFARGVNRGIPYGDYESISAAARGEGVTPQAVWQRVKRS